jgi:hypothetical protein
MGLRLSRWLEVVGRIRMGMKRLWFRRVPGALGSRGTGSGLVILCMGNLGLICASVQINTAVGGVLVVVMLGNRESIEEQHY